MSTHRPTQRSANETKARKVEGVGMSAEKTETKEYSDIRVRKVRILQGEARKAAERVGAGDDDLVILKTSHDRSRLKYEAEKIVGDPVVYLAKMAEEGLAKLGLDKELIDLAMELSPLRRVTGLSTLTYIVAQ